MSGFPPSRREPRGSARFECAVSAQAAVAATRRPSSPRQASPPPASPAAQPCPPPSSYRSSPLAPPPDCAELDVPPRCHPASSQRGHTRLRRDRCCRQPATHPVIPAAAANTTPRPPLCGCSTSCLRRLLLLRRRTRCARPAAAAPNAAAQRATTPTECRPRRRPPRRVPPPAQSVGQQSATCEVPPAQSATRA